MAECDKFVPETCELPKIFAEYIRVEGYVPLNFLSGTSTGGATTHSVRGADGNIMMFGVQAAM